jgi:hypothetical protein
VLVPATAGGASALGPSFAEISGIGALIGAALGVGLVFLMRRKPRAAASADELDLADESAPITDRDLPEDHLDDQDFFDEDDHEIYGQPVYDEPVYEQPAYQPQQHLRQRLPAPANDSPLADHIREVLMANRRPAQEVEIPPLVAAVMAGRLADMPAYAPAHSVPRRPAPSPEEIRKAEELRELRRNMAELRERVQVYSARRNASRG